MRDANRNFFGGEGGRGRLARVVELDGVLRRGEGFYPSIF